MNPVDLSILRILHGRETHFFYDSNRPLDSKERRGRISLVLYHSPGLFQVKPVTYIDYAFLGDGTPLNSREQKYSFADIIGIDLSDVRKPVILGNIFKFNIQSNRKTLTDREVSFEVSKIVPPNKSKIFDISSQYLR
jgi:hypothetical protein